MQNEFKFQNYALNHHPQGVMRVLNPGRKKKDLAEKKGFWV